MNYEHHHHHDHGHVHAHGHAHSHGPPHAHVYGHDHSHVHVHGSPRRLQDGNYRSGSKQVSRNNHISSSPKHVHTYGHSHDHSCSPQRVCEATVVSRQPSRSPKHTHYVTVPSRKADHHAPVNIIFSDDEPEPQPRPTIISKKSSGTRTKQLMMQNQLMWRQTQAIIQQQAQINRLKQQQVQAAPVPEIPAPVGKPMQDHCQSHSPCHMHNQCHSHGHSSCNRDDALSKTINADLEVRLRELERASREAQEKTVIVNHECKNDRDRDFAPPYYAARDFTPQPPSTQDITKSVEIEVHRALLQQNLASQIAGQSQNNQKDVSPDILTELSNARMKREETERRMQQLLDTLATREDGIHERENSLLLREQQIANRIPEQSQPKDGSALEVKFLKDEIDGYKDKILKLEAAERRQRVTRMTSKTSMSVVQARYWLTRTKKRKFADTMRALALITCTMTLVSGFAIGMVFVCSFILGHQECVYICAIVATISTIFSIYFLCHRYSRYNKRKALENQKTTSAKKIIEDDIARKKSPSKLPNPFSPVAPYKKTATVAAGSGSSAADQKLVKAVQNQQSLQVKQMEAKLKELESQLAANRFSDDQQKIKTEANAKRIKDLITKQKAYNRV